MQLSALLKHHHKKIALYTLILAAFIGFMAWLWQRQPNPQEALESPKIATPEAKIAETRPLKTPKDASIFKEAKVKVEGTTGSGEFIAIYSNDFQTVAKASEKGQFEAEISLTPGLNLVAVFADPKSPKAAKTEFLTLWLSPKGDEETYDTVYAGSVKSILSGVLTASTLSGEKTIRTTKFTKINLPPPPKDEETPDEPKVTDIRVGDYITALGTASDPNSQVAKIIDVIRENKPQIQKELIFAEIETQPRQNLFSVKDQEGKIRQFSIGKNTKIQIAGDDGKATDVTGDKSALIFFHEENNKNAADLIYLLP